MFKCKVCLEKDKMIAELTKQVELMRSIIYPSSITNSQAFMQSLEANKILSGETHERISIDTNQDPTEGESFDHWN